jgi:hypothetical protein
MPGAEAVTVRRDETYRVAETGPLTMDLLIRRMGAAPAVVFDRLQRRGRARMLGCRMKEMGISRGRSWRGFRAGRHHLREP